MYDSILALITIHLLRTCKVILPCRFLSLFNCGGPSLPTSILHVSSSIANLHFFSMHLKSWSARSCECGCYMTRTRSLCCRANRYLRSHLPVTFACAPLQLNVKVPPQSSCVLKITKIAHHGKRPMTVPPISIGTRVDANPSRVPTPRLLFRPRGRADIESTTLTSNALCATHYR